jgi:hypothetical protein
MAYTARPTIHNGIRMRSRLEASFAAHLDNVGERWQYEPECYSSAAGQYLPDFVVRGGYYEVKPTREAAIGGLARSHVILTSKPDATLFAVWPKGWDATGVNGGGYYGWYCIQCSPDSPCGGCDRIKHPDVRPEPPPPRRPQPRCWRCQTPIAEAGHCEDCAHIEGQFDELDRLAKIAGRHLELTTNHSHPYVAVNRYINRKLRASKSRRRTADPSRLGNVITAMRSQIKERGLDPDADDPFERWHDLCSECHEGTRFEMMPEPSLCQGCWLTRYEVCWDCTAVGVTRTKSTDDPICDDCWARQSVAS